MVVTQARARRYGPMVVFMRVIFVDGSRTGKGKYVWPDGGVYEGDFVDGSHTGKGKYVSASGDFYEGDFVDGSRTGKGKYLWADGDFL